MGRAGIAALAAVGRERENPRSERSEPAALKVQLGEVGTLQYYHAKMPMMLMATSKWRKYTPSTAAVERKKRRKRE